MATSSGRLTGVVAAAVLVASCGGGSGGEESDAVGELVTVAGGGGVQAGELDELASAAPTDVDLDPGPGGSLTIAAGPDDSVWLLLGGVSRSDVGLGALVVEVAGDRVMPVEALQDVSPGAGIAVAADGTVTVAQVDRRQLLRHREGEVTASRPDGVAELSDLAAGPDGSVFVADQSSEQIVAITEDNQVRPLVDDVVASPLAVDPDGTVYFVDRETSRVRAVSPEGEVRTVAGGGDAEPADGAPARDSTLTATGLAANDDGLHILFGNEVWRVDDDGRLDLVLRRGDDASLVGMAGADDRVYVLDDATSTVSVIEQGS